MGKFVKGDVVVVPFPFSDLSNSKKRPALVVTNLKGDDVILYQITSTFRKDSDSIPLFDEDFIKGSLNQASTIRPNRLFTADSKIIIYPAGKISSLKINEVINKIV